MRDFARYVILAPLKPSDSTAAHGASRRIAAEADRTPTRIGDDATGAADASPARFTSAVPTRFGACP